MSAVRRRSGALRRGPNWRRSDVMNDMMFPEANVKRDPADVELVRQVTLQQLSEWLLQLMDGLPEHSLKRVRDLNSLKTGLSPIFREMRDGDTVWLCRSRLIGPLHGHQGVALVRDKRPIVYIRALNF